MCDGLDSVKTIRKHGHSFRVMISYDFHSPCAPDLRLRGPLLAMRCGTRTLIQEIVAFVGRQVL